MHKIKFMKQLYGILFCISFCTFNDVEAQSFHEEFKENQPNLNFLVGGTAIVSVGVIVGLINFVRSASKNNNIPKKSAQDNDSYQAKAQEVETISVSRGDSHDDSVCVNRILQPACRKNGLPRIIIRSVINNTPYNLEVVNVVDDWHFTVLAYKQVRLNDAVVENYKNIVVMGSLFDCLHGNAHIEIVEVNASGSLSQDNGAFLNMCVVSNDVSEGSLDFKFLMAGPNGGCLMSWDRLKNNQCKDVEVQLTLTVNPHDIQKNIFRIIGSYTIVEK